MSIVVSHMGLMRMRIQNPKTGDGRVSAFPTYVDIWRVSQGVVLSNGRIQKSRTQK
jgi:hypothetical protein